jgi:outer membrane protein assembly factor BamB
VSIAPAVAGDLVYVGSCAGTLFALDRATGQPAWTYDIRQDGDQTQFHSEALLTDDLLVIGTDGNTVGYVYAFEKRTGHLRWKHRIEPAENARRPGNSVGVRSEILRAGSRVYASTYDNRLLSLDLATGALLWERTMEGAAEADFVAFSPVVLEQRLVYADPRGTVRALDGASGRELWTRVLDAPASSDLAAADGHVYAGTWGSRLYRLDSRNGEIVTWREMEGPPVGKPLLVDDQVVVITDPRLLVALDRDLTTVRWTQKTPREWTSPRLLLWRGLVLSGNREGELVGFRLHGGRPCFRQRLGRSMVRGLGASRDVVYAGTFSGEVHALVLTTPGLPAAGDR